MGENAKKSWEWHNTEVGAGYQAKGVVRQRVAEHNQVTKIVDMRMSTGPQATEISAGNRDKVTEENRKEKKKDKKREKSKKHRRDESDDSSVERQPRRQRMKFNPLLQALSVRLRDNLVQK